MGVSAALHSTTADSAVSSSRWRCAWSPTWGRSTGAPAHTARSASAAYTAPRSSSQCRRSPLMWRPHTGTACPISFIRKPVPDRLMFYVHEFQGPPLPVATGIVVYGWGGGGGGRAPFPLPPCLNTSFLQFYRR
jgi:hypothetical protein